MSIHKNTINHSLVLIAGGIVLNSMAANAAPVPIETSTLDRDAGSTTNYGIGFTSSFAQRPFVGVDVQDASLPYFSLRYKDLYVEGLNIGYNLWKNDKWLIDVLATPRFYEVEPSFADNNELDGIDKTKRTYFAGVSGQYASKHITYTLQLLTDVIESDGSEIVATGSKAFKLSNSFTLTPTLGITYQDSKLVDHFYGVQPNEVAVGRPAYGGEDSTNFHISLTGVWDTTKHIQLLGQLKYELLGDGIGDSPIVDDTDIATLAVGLVYRF